VQLVALFDLLLNASRVMYKLTEVRSRLLRTRVFHIRKNQES
jgi:hypothetical protein